MGDAGPTNVSVVDIRRDKTNMSLLNLVRESLSPKNGSQPSLPTLLLYDEQGLKLFEDITYIDEYYLTNAEIETLQKYAHQIAARIPAGSRLLELGSGNLRKVDILLQAFEAARKPVDYYALDLSLDELQRTFPDIGPSKYHYVSLNALHGTYDDALSWIAGNLQSASPLCVMSMGSSMGNFTKEEAAEFLNNFASKLRPSDYVLIGLDACQDERRVHAAYNDSKGLTEQFYRNGLDHVNRLLGYEAFRHDQWNIEGVYNKTENRHEASYVALTDVRTSDFDIRQGQQIFLEYAHKYSGSESDDLWHKSGLIPQMAYGNKAGDYYLHLLSPASIDFPVRPSEYATHPVPLLKDWESLWAAWDTVTRSMVPRDELLNKPIHLRNNLIFYLGHIPTFADIHFTKATGANPMDPAYYVSIFERGIDPDVDNPEVCHDHSEIPDSWPPLDEILDYSSRVRARILDSIHTEEAFKDRKLGRGLWLAYEHEAMHLETFLYMLLQSSRVLPPPGESTPNFVALAQDAKNRRERNEWNQIPAAKVKVGLDDAENDLAPDRYFGWDNERPSRVVSVPGFKAHSRSISNGEYAKFLEDAKFSTLPSSWITRASLAGDAKTTVHDIDAKLEMSMCGPETASWKFIADKAVRTVYGPVPLSLALDWPVMASYDELAAYAKWADGRIPTFEEARSIYSYVERQKKLQAEQIPSTLISAVNGHLSNDGVEETPPSQVSESVIVDGKPSTVAAPFPDDYFIDLDNHNVGFKKWHPSAITGEGHRLRGQSDVGGLWEWTSSPLAAFEGFKAMDLYPGYTADFFDEKHNVVLGGSWASVPRIAGRKSFVNWYQRNYPYTWATARLVRNLD